jgi:transcriptional regulator with XRE-family HTH domain
MVQANQKEIISANIFHLMELNNIPNISKLAEKIGCNRSTINNLTQMINESPSIATVKMIADFFCVSLDDFVNDNLIHLSQFSKKKITKLFYSDHLKLGEVKDYIFSANNTDNYSIAINLSKRIYPYQKGDILFFEKLNIETVSFPCLMLIRNNNTLSIEMIHSIDNDLYLKRKNTILSSKETLILLSDHYESPEVLQALVEVKFHHDVDTY